jgi:hypothetical protein
MSAPDPRHAAASVPVATPPAPQWGGQVPSVIDPGLIARLANSSGQHIPAGGLATDVTGIPEGAAAPGPVVGLSGLSPEKGQASSQGFLGEADLRALPQGLGQLTSLVPTTFPSGFAGFSHAAMPGGNPALPDESLYFLKEAGPAVAAHWHRRAPAPQTATIPDVPGKGIVAPEPQATEALAPPFEQSPTYASSYPTEAELRPQSLGEPTSHPFFSNPSHDALSTGYPVIPGESLYFFE